MVSPSFSMSEDLLKEFDKTLNELKREGEIDMDTRRSEVVRELMKAWIDENQEGAQGNFQTMISASNPTETATSS